MTLWETRSRGILSPRFLDRRVEVSLPSRGGVYNPVMDWVGVELIENTVYLVVELEWRARGEFGGTNLELSGRVRATGSLYLSDEGWRTFGVALADGGDPERMFDGAWQVTWREGFAFANPDRDDVTATVRVVEVGTSILSYENVRMVLPPFLLERMGGVERSEMAVIALGRLSFSNMTVFREYYRAFLELGPFDEEKEYDVLSILQAVVGTRPGIPTVTEEVVWEIARREIGCGMTKIPEGSVRRYKPVGKKAKPVSILLEMTKEEAMEKEGEVLRVIGERRVAEGHRIPDEVAQTMKIRVKGFLTEQETQGIKEVCQESHLAFAFNDHQKERLDAKLIPPVRIHTVEHECWNDKGPAYDFGIAREVTELLRAKIDSFVAEPTASPYANKWFVFRKPNNSLRWIQDLQKLNAVTIRDAGSLPQADLLAEFHAGRSIYSLINLYSGYDQLPLDARDRPYTAMHTSVGQLQMQVTPMGFTNAVAEAQRRMLAVAGDMFPDKYEPYIDNNPVKGAREKDETEVQSGIKKFVWDHLQDIRELLRRFLEYNIATSGPKSILAVPEVTILGFRCGAYGRKLDPAKTDKIAQWSTPLRTTTKVRAFLGVVGFWRIFIKGFAKIAESIRAMIREEGTLDWTEERESVVQTLKNILTSEEVTLAAPCFNDEVGRPFILETDGGPMAVGGVLNYKGEDGRERPIRFESRTLNSAARHYSQFKKEVLAILHCLKTFQGYLFGRRFILRIDPTNVVGALKNYKPIDPTVGRWVGFIWQFDYKIERIVGLRNRANGLSRVVLTPEGLEEAKPIDAFLDYEGGTLVVDSEMAGTTCTTGELLIKALEKGPPTVVAELREGTVTRVGRREEKDAWGSVVKPRDEQIALAIEGGWRRVMSMMESQKLEMQHFQAYQVDNNQTGTQEEEQFFLIKSYEGIEVTPTKMASNNENNINQANINVDDPWRQPGRPQNRNRPALVIGPQPQPPVRTRKRKMRVCRPSPTKEGDVLPAWPEDESEQEREERREEKGTEDQHKEQPGRGSRKDAKGSTEEDNETGEDIPEIVIVSSDDEMDRVSRPRPAGQASTSRASEEVHDWEEVFDLTPSHWFEVWASTFRHDWIIIARSLMAAGERVTPTDFFSKETLHNMKATLDKIRTYGLAVAPPPKTEEGRGAKRQRTGRDTGN
ncbi:hypothetical protein CBR_g9081 [Chara braunii]|uniref:Uncharacterized protein n=1 Tax=Chara braunii TaxID=69332 RepID=A0A388KNN1_CHABU|nr:hypothetical protein CBR_g9081 [Chara braunii]|eukprot:GBG71666.1 hypothetical protein CBR_g9081 [Chara braunii]